MAKGRIVVVGASSGGIRALQSLAAQLDGDFPAPILAVQHIGSHPSILPSLLSRRGLPASHAADGERIRKGHIHVAPPDRHMMLDGDRLRISHGPKENHARPAIDPLFRSAAITRGADVIGVVLTGNLDDGTAGLQAIARRGGTVVVQDPKDAEAASMPRSALTYVRADHVVALDAMGALLERLARQASGRTPRVEEHVALENDVMLGKGDPMTNLSELGQPSTFVCPDCSGVLWRLRGTKPARFRCHTGHGYTLRSLHHAQTETTDEAVWGALRALQEKEMLLRVLAEDAAGEEGKRFLDEAAEVAVHAETLRAFVERMPSSQEEAAS